MLTTTLPANAAVFSCAVVAAESHGVAIDYVALSSSRVVSVRKQRFEIGPRQRDRHELSIARYFGADDHCVSNGCQTTRKGTARRPGPTEDANSHRCSLTRRSHPPRSSGGRSPESTTLA
jgi:hypothetical protein